jgi:RNA polymerase sigma-70 factor, ECF subfamily
MGRILSGSVQDEFTEFYWECLPRLRGYLRRRLSSEQTRNELENKIMTLAWQRFESGTADAPSFAWLAGIAGGVIANERRSQRRQNNLLERLHGERRTRPDDALGAFGSVEGLDPRVERSLDSLSPENREVLLLRVWDDCSYAEIAAASGLNEAAVRKRLSRAMTRFGDQFSGLADEGGEPRVG